MRVLTHRVTWLWVFVVALMHGLYVNVISADPFFTLSALALCALLALVISFYFFRWRFREEPPFGNVVTRPLMILLIPCVMAGVIWLVAAKSIPWTAAILFGVPHAESHTFTVSTYRRKGCNSVAKPVKRMSMFGSLCVTEDYVRQHGGSIVSIRLVGDRTPLGFRITRIEHEAALGPAPIDRHRR